MMKRKEGKGKKKLVTIVMTAMIVFSLMPAFVPMAAAADVTAFTITPTTGTAGATVAYDVSVKAAPWSKLNISIPAGFEVVAPTTGDQEIVRADFYGSTGAWCGNISVTSDSSKPSEKVWVTGYNESKVAGDFVQFDIDYEPGATTEFVPDKLKTMFPTWNASINLTLPTATANGSLNVSLPGSMTLTNITLNMSAKNPETKGIYTFNADGETDDVTINPAEDVKLAVYPDTPKTADGADTAAIHVYAQDQYGNNVTLPSAHMGASDLGITTNSTTVTFETSDDFANDRFIVNMTDTVAENVEIIALDIGSMGGNPLADGVGVQTFRLPTAGVTLTTDKAEIVANNSDTTTIKAQLMSDGTPVQKVADISFQSLNDTRANVIEVNGVAGTTGTTYSNGTAFATIIGNNSYALGTVGIRAISEGKVGTIDLDLVVGPPDDTESTLKAYNATWTDISGENATVGAKVTISATLKDEIGTPTHPALSGEWVTFSIVESPSDGASLSSTTTRAQSDAYGHANATLTLSTKSGENKVQVKSDNGDVNKTVSVWGDNATVTLASAVDNATIASNVAISARLLDPINGTAINGTDITFSVVSPGDDAVVSPDVVSTVNGYANTTLTLSTETGTNTVRAISTRYDVNTTVVVMGNAGNATRLNLTIDKASLPTGAEAMLTAKLFDAYANPTALNATGGTGAVNVSFTQDTTEYGNLTAAHNDTVSGETTTTFNASAKSGTTTIIASADGLTSDSVSIFTGAPVSISLKAEPINIPMNQSDQNSTITAQLLDIYGTPISVQGRKITFTASVPGNVTLTNLTTGDTSHPLVGYTDVNGTAQINLTSTESIIEKITVTAMPQGLHLKQVDVRIRGTASKINLSADPSTRVVANGTDKSVITAQLKDDEGNDVAQAGTEVTFSATAGTLSAYTVDTDSSGVASVNLTWTSATAGDITVYAVGGTLTMDTVTVGFVPTPELMEGDVDRSGCVDISDAMLIAQHVVGTITLNATQLTCADTTDEGDVDISDAMHIAQYTVDPEGTLGVLYKPLWESPADDDMLEPVPC